MSNTTCNIAILISGSGSNLQSFIDQVQSGELKANISVVISNKPDVRGLQRAQSAGISTEVIEHKLYGSREAFDLALVKTLDKYPVDLVILAGFMRILTPVFIQPYQGRLLNIHPSLLPKYPGLNTHQRALDAGDTATGATVHFVTEELDGGPPIVQTQVPIQAGDNAEVLAAKVLKQEHIIYPLAASWFAENRLRLENGKGYLDDQPIPETGVLLGN